MKLSNKGRYGVRAMFDIAFHNEGRATQVKDIARRQAIPPRFLEQIFQDLKRAGLVTSKRGPRGGYQLAQPAADVHIADVVRALEGPIALAAGRSEQAEEDHVSKQVIDTMFTALAEKIEACLASVSLADLCEQAKDEQAKEKKKRRYVYSI